MTPCCISTGPTSDAWELLALLESVLDSRIGKSLYREALMQVNAKKAWAELARYETLLDGLQPWQVKKLYYFPDSSDDTIFKNTGPTYPTTGISPSRKLPYWRIAMEL